MACVDKHHFAGGTERGYQFLSDNPHLVGSFITSTKPGMYIHISNQFLITPASMTNKIHLSKYY